MRRVRGHRTFAVVTMLAIVAVDCGGATHAISPSRTAASPLSSASTNSASVPNPFTVTVRYSANSLGLNKPANLAIGPDGNLYVADSSQRVTVISPQGEVLRRWGQPGKGPGQFAFIQHEAGAPGVAAGIAVGADGRVYVDDSGNARIQVFTPTGAFIRQFGSFGNGKNQFLFSNYLVVDRNGDVYVADDQKETLSKFSPSGALEWLIGGTSQSDPDLSGHFHLSSSSVDSHGRILMANDDQNRIVYVDARGDNVDAFGSSEDFRDGACDVTVDAAGYTFVNSCQEPLASPHYTEVFDRTHHLVGAWYPSPLGWAPQFGPHGEIFTLGEDGSILRLRVALPDA